MPLAAPKLDDRLFQDLVEEAKKRIPHYTSEWTDHNVSDPGITLLELFAWDEADFLRHTEGSPIRRIGHECWLRNLAVALGNAPASADIIAALQRRSDHGSALVREHVAWALQQQHTKLSRKETLHVSA